MNNKLTIIGLTITSLYLIALYYGIEGRLVQIKTMDLNNLGDFFAGVFGPLAILWLILGFFQQGKELKQNTEALRLQAEELKSSVIQQEKLAKTTQQQLDHQISIENAKQLEIESSSRPKFIIKNTSSVLERALDPDADYKDYPNGDIYIVNVKLLNIGQAAENINIDVRDNRLDEMFGWHHHGCNTGETIGFKFKIKYDPRIRHEEVKVKVICRYDFIGVKSHELLLELDFTNIDSSDSGVIGMLKN